MTALWTASAHADGEGLSADVTKAQELFEDGRHHVDAGDCTLAITSFRASIQYNDSVGAHLNLANCLAGEPLAQWQELKAAEALARRKNDRRADEARARAEALRPKLALVTIIAPQKDGQLLTDAKPVDATYLGEPLAVAGGAHIIELVLPDGTHYTANIAAKVGGTVTAKLALPAAPESKTTAVDPEAPSPLHRIGLIGVAVGVLGLGAGAVATGIAATKLSDAKAACPGYPHCSSLAQSNAALDLNDSGRHAATAATIAFIAGGVFVAGGVVLMLIAPKHAPANVGALAEGVRW